MSRMRAHDAAPWGWRPIVLPCVALAALIALGNAATHLLHPNSVTAALVYTVVLDVVLYGVLIAVMYLAGRPLAARYAGWGWTFGLQRPRWMDGAWVAAGIGMVLLSRLVVVIVANTLTQGRAGEQSQNLVVHSHSPAVYVVLGVLAVLVAPPVEETMFRGLLLRTFMWRWGFWPAAVLSSLIFAGFHLYEVDTVAGAATLGAVVFALGLVNSLLVRWSGRLAAGMIVHALFNLFAVLVLVFVIN
jgi:uncharacterized protein